MYPALLQPITATTPLAALFNRWLLALAPAAALIDTSRPSAARDLLQDATTGLHFSYDILTRTMKRLEAGKDLKPLRRFFRFSHYRPSLARPVLDTRPVYALALRAHELREARQVYKIVGYTWEHLDKLLALRSPFAAEYAALETLLKQMDTVAAELDEWEPTDEAGRTALLAQLQHIITASTAAK